MKIVSLNVALPSAQRYGEQEVFTGGTKRPVPRATLRFHNFDGDGQADRDNHGGPDKAVCVYPRDHYAFWEERLGRALDPGAFSENLTISGALETEVCIGDVFEAGEAVAQVCQPRMPCYKVAGKNAQKLLPKWMTETGYTGFYMRVLEEGEVEAGDSFEVVSHHPDGISISDVNDLLYARSNAPALIQRLDVLPEFSEAGRSMLSRRLDHPEIS